MSVRTVQLDEVAEFINGRAFKPSEWGQRGTPIIRIQNLTGTNEVFNYFDGPIDERIRVRKGDILISWSASLGVYRWNGEDAALNQHIFKVRLNDGIDRDYFYYAATDAMQEMASRVHGSTMQHITKDRFDSILIPLPDLSEQERIAGILKQADRLRRTRRYALELSDTFLPAAFLKSFGDPFTNENQWECTSLEAVTTQITDGEHATPKRSLAGIKLLSARNIQNGFIDLSPGVDFVPQSEFVRIRKRCWPRKGDVLMSCSGTIGRVATVNSDEPLTLVRSVALIRPNPNRIVSQYLEHYLRSSYMQMLIDRSANQSSQANIFTGPIKALPCLVPPPAQQQRFVALVARHERLRAEQGEALRQADHLFQSLLPRAFAGEL